MKTSNSDIHAGEILKITAESVGLVYVNDQKPGITRKRRGKHFYFFMSNGKRITDTKEIERIHKLAIPPAYKDVWICPNKNGHMQATGRDDKGRKQYRYHTRWRLVRDENKYNKTIAFGHALPAIRKRVHDDLKLPGLSKNKILATVVNLLQVTLIRVGNDEYARTNHSFGLTTLKNKHVNVTGSTINFKFRGKSGVNHKISIQDARLARIVKRCKDIPGQDLFEYYDENGEVSGISSTEINEYIKSITNEDFTAKDFRTWAGTVLATYALQALEKFDNEAQAKKNIVKAIELVAKKLGNTPSICRKCYIHPEVLNAYVEGSLVETFKMRAEIEFLDSLIELSPEESAVLSFLKNRLAQ